MVAAQSQLGFGMGIGISHGFATLGTIEPIADVVDPVLGAERASRDELGRSETAVTLR